MSKKKPVTEIFDNKKDLLKKTKKFAKLIKYANRIVFFTGAGVSTSAGIPDYRGPNGVWTCEEEGREPPKASKPWSEMSPTFAHMSIAKLHEMGKVKHVITQNVDTLHLKSGIKLENISELHGNPKKEICRTCGKQYLRNQSVITSEWIYEHAEERVCECGGDLRSSLIDFGMRLNKHILKKATEESKKADLFIVLGSSLRVTPACDLPQMCVKQGTGKLVICNLQKTQKDKFADICIHEKTDKIFFRVMKLLKIDVPYFESENKNEKKTQNQEKKKKKKKKKKKENQNEKENINEEENENENEKEKEIKKSFNEWCKKEAQKNNFKFKPEDFQEISEKIAIAMVKKNQNQR
ncbi:nad-dependent protein deacetylase sirtuin-(6/7) family member [Anaeramoeba flamelloides]|uniref:protein acetyllysine N-acetyltransferase n=1 Tax=Anaeramoeba flamelloides TaxID=1746091 RepID=A0AAV7Z723_9EUKA|nr:nad-dependent protein deacetylase sirtuin-(6/7) family member [Anaeramoeba flamelloides]